MTLPRGRLGAAMLLFAAAMAAAAPTALARPIEQPSRSEGDVVPLRLLRIPAKAPSHTTADTVTVYSESLETFVSPGSEGGWTHLDKSGQPTAWHIATDFACQGHSFWCGLIDSTWTGDPDRKGYDNNWTQQATNFVDLSGAVSPVKLGFKHHLNVESGFDFAILEVFDPVYDWIPLKVFTGVVDPSGAAICDTVTAQIPDSIIAKTTSISFRFRFTSDFSGSSSDGLYPNADGWSIDNVTVKAGTSDVRFFDDFEAGLGTWIISTFPSVGDKWRVVTNAATEQLCVTNSSKMWTATDPTTGSLISRANDILQSPPVAVNGADQSFLSFDVYRNLSFDACFYYNVNYRKRKTTDPGWSAWTNPSGLLYYGNEQEWVRQTVALVGAGGADSVQFRVTVADYGPTLCDGNSAASGTLLLLDNFAVRVIGLAGPSLTLTEGDLYQDTFKTTAFFADDNFNTPKGDSLVVRIGASRGLKTASLFYSLNAAPFTSTALLPAPGGAANAYQADVPAGAYARGTNVRYYFSATDSLNAVATLPADAIAASHYFTATILPAVQSPSGLCAGDTARVLYVNAETPIDAVSGLEQGLQAIGLRYDRYDVNGPAQGFGNGPGGGNPADPTRIWPGIPLATLGIYSTIVWDVGNRTFLTLTEQDQALLQSWIALTGRNRNLLVAGDNVAYDMIVNGREIPNFLSCTLGATYVRDIWENTPQDSLQPIPTGAAGTRVAGTPFPLDGGCPTINNFDAISTSSCAGGTGRAWVVYPNTLTAATERRAALGAPGGDSARAILTGFSFNTMKSPAQRNVFLWNTVVWEFEEPYCSIPTAVLPTPEASAPSPRPRLLGAAPNPFNPHTTIRFDLPRAAHVRLRVFDVRGALVRTLADRPFGAGIQQVVWDGVDARGRNAATGTYFYRLEADGVAEARKLTLLR